MATLSGFSVGWRPIWLSALISLVGQGRHLMATHATRMLVVHVVVRGVSGDARNHHWRLPTRQTPFAVGNGGQL